MKKQFNQETLKVAANSSPKAVAGVLAMSIRENGFGELQAIGAKAINQAVKAIAIARGYLAPEGYNLICVPAFTEGKVRNESCTAIRFIVTLR